jgi:hypothetical protein
MSAKNLPYWHFNKECGSLDNLLLFEMVLQGKMLPVTRKDAVWICHIDSEKCYYVGTEAVDPKTRVKKLFEFMMFGINVYSIYIKRIYNRGGFFYVFIYILLLIPLALYMLCVLLRLHPQEGRWGLPYRKAP